jgi:fused signal recognition particle receptor
MFGSLKKRLKDAVEKATSAIKEKKEEPKETIAEKKEPAAGKLILEEPEVPEVKEEIAVAEAEPRKEEPIIKEEPIFEEPKEVTIEETVEKKEIAAEEPKVIIIPEVKKDADIETAEKEEKKIEKLPPVSKPVKEKRGFFKKILGKKPVAEEKKEEKIITVEEKKEVDELIELEEAEKGEMEEKKGLFSKILETTITENDLDVILKELKFALLENDVAIDVVEKISSDVSNELKNKNVKRGAVEESIRTALRNAMLDVMSQEKIDLRERIEKKDGVYTIMFLGFNGVGKTTCLAKLAKKFGEYKPIVAAADTFRAASIEQLEEHSRRAEFRLVKHSYGADPAAVIFDARKAAEASGSKLVLADTAGRSHSNVNLMDELKKVARVNKPDMKVLVLDSVTGNDIYEQSRLFNEAVGVDAIILTKADVYEKGGAALSATYTIKKPILYLGIGQEYADLKEFNAEEIVDNLLKE